MPGFYHYLWLFLSFSFLGWCWETVIVSIQQKKFVNRGFLTGPICPIYGVGICLVVLLLSPLPKTWWVLLFGGGLIAAAVEYFVGWLLEKIFRQRWWDYSDHRFNLNGRIALPETLFWAPLAMLAMLFFVPWFVGIVNKIPQGFGWWLFGFVTALCIVDIVIICKRMDHFTKVADALREQAERFRENTDVLREKFEENAEAFREAVEESIRFRVEDSRTKWQKRRDKMDEGLKRRLTGAFPKLSERWRVDDDDEK